MSDLDIRPQITRHGGRDGVSASPVRELLPGREVALGESTVVRRLLPTLGRRMVGAWCFIDHYGPDDVAGRPGMQVPPHPHIGLQTVSWLLDGEVVHRDSLGSLQTLRPGRLGLMTAGNAIAHSEVSPPEHGRLLHGAQLWVALPDAFRAVDPRWEYHGELPVLEERGLRATVIMGEMAGAASPGTAYTPLVGVDLDLAAGAAVTLPLEPDFEYAVLSASGDAEVDGVPVPRGSLLYLGCGRPGLALRAESASRLLLLGGEPFEERIVMWWNFVARSGDEIAAARADWMDGDRFGTVTGYDGRPLPAPALPALPLKPRGRAR
ncbi:pirin family protein [Microbispora sp. RL4-1S]|uniref:Pirin family protein n=1 Tax=Microbispora oryzae TaxID=2806554 RepID=A0A941AHD7_9ACTN|nr:pirin family protein [Microbispora oryzae]MBP2703976.1 pirin family protein [Microbispora oryzae]